MGQKEDVEAYYKQLAKLNSVFTLLRVQDSFLKEIFRFGLWKRLRIFTVGMPKHFLEEVVELVKQVKNDMTSGWSRIRKKHRNFITSFSLWTSSSASSWDEKGTKLQKDKKNDDG